MHQTSIGDFLQGVKRKSSTNVTRKEKVPKSSGERDEVDSDIDIDDIEK